jgi:predicted Rossmann fold nucleotide-binding protein DprA/Smf involved in DNA uptake
LPRHRSATGMTLGTLVAEANLTSIDEIIRGSGLPSAAVNATLFSLEMKRLIKQLPGKLFVRNK